MSAEDEKRLEEMILKYDLIAMREHVKKREANIAVFEKAISDERVGIEYDLGIIAVLERRHVGQV